MKAEDLQLGKWYFCEMHHPKCQYFQCIKHGYRFNQSDNTCYTIKAINNRTYYGNYFLEYVFIELTPEEKLRLL